jgi:hypothetical protein
MKRRLGKNPIPLPARFRRPDLQDAEHLRPPIQIPCPRSPGPGPSPTASGSRQIWLQNPPRQSIACFAQTFEFVPHATVHILPSPRQWHARRHQREGGTPFAGFLQPQPPPGPMPDVSSEFASHENLSFEFSAVVFRPIIRLEPPPFYGSAALVPGRPSPQRSAPWIPRLEN